MASKRKAKSQEFIDDSDDPEDTGSKTKKSRTKSAAATTQSSDIDTEELIPLSAKRFVNVRTFKGRIMIDIREYYVNDDGENRPGKKGISLSVDQWEKLKEAMETIDERIHNS
ncbi:PREDICTED: activated RNA polymerase II transcriptional coactivator p15-like [Amphimedon queenslandica]|uniref:Transcriptional coactivator p15 (PC4) C-terminal domain-containing protein n=1 Tax=Amphimedon queenslandica TaxID=400682 RepID=A0A1X7U2Q5_AMPQE|nr:PREDICTED: activated RNA polymerase II transcriptional coactivator p15-like [Amphimedon queenslandica]|eukprot:XP_003389148.1 PREDICTED: activated RNA polymerase II transcriptional coactivator p15-like [Amphimedon queenslandica]